MLNNGLTMQHLEHQHNCPSEKKKRKERGHY